LTENIQKGFEEFFTAEFWAESIAKGMAKDKLSPIDNFQANILKSMVLYATSKNISEIWTKIATTIDQEKGRSFNDDFFSMIELLFTSVETGMSAYFVYTEQALVSSVSSMEVYFKDRLIASINKDKRLLLPFSEKQISVGRIVDYELDLESNISKLIVERMNLQDLEEVRKNYKKIYGFYPFTKEQLERLEFIFNSRHIIIHNSGFVDHEISYKKKSFFSGQRIYFERKEIIDMIQFINKLIIELDSKIESKYKGEVE
jgi:hypothetical protein